MRVLHVLFASLALLLTACPLEDGKDTGDTDALCFWHADEDGDGYGATEAGVSASCASPPEGYLEDDQDCDDGDATINPDGTEVCDGADNDCDGETDEDDAVDVTTFYQDADGDRYGDASITAEACEAPDDYVVNDEDCDDDDAEVNPDAEEICDDIDNDCDDLVDDEDDDVTDPATWYLDADEDGFGDPDTTASACEAPSGYVDAASDGSDFDCDDDDPEINPDATEYCDEVDNDCDDLVDDEDDDVPEDALAWYPDEDEDGYGDETGETWACEAPEGYLSDGLDCDDDDPEINPDATEYCDGVDNDCDDEVDEDDAADATSWFLDSDGDGYGDDSETTLACDLPSGYADNADDCDDDEPTTHPGADEYCDEVDNDCDDEVDEDDAVDAPTWYMDLDGDDYGDDGDTTTSCEAPHGYVADGGDCDETDSDINPGADEYCDDIDNNCDGFVDESTAVDAETWYSDFDGDGYGSDTTTRTACTQPTNFTDNDEDCDDTDASIHPGALDNDNDGVDDDCSGTADQVKTLAFATAKLTGEDSGDYAGNALDGGWDLDGDGVDDLGVAAWQSDRAATRAGAVYLFQGPVTGTLDLGSADAILTGADSYAGAGYDFAMAGDLDGDGFVDLAVAESSDETDYDCATRILHGPVSGTVNLSDADDIVDGSSDATAGLGYSLDATGDLDGDGVDDLLAGAPWSQACSGSDCTVFGATYFLAGTSGGDLSFTGSLTAETEGAYLGTAVAGLGDIDGDGLADTLCGAPGSEAAYLMNGPVTAGYVPSEADAVLTADGLGEALAGPGDVDGDGYDDLLLGASSDDTEATNAGIAYLLSGPVSGEVVLADDADAILYGEVASDAAGGAVSGAGDVNDDGYEDLLVGAKGDDTGGSAAGTAYLWFGPVSGTVSVGQADYEFYGENASDYAGITVSPAGDTDADGLDDFLVGAYGEDTGGSMAGAAYLQIGWGL